MCLFQIKLPILDLRGKKVILWSHLSCLLRTSRERTQRLRWPQQQGSQPSDSTPFHTAEYQFQGAAGSGQPTPTGGTVQPGLIPTLRASAVSRMQIKCLPQVLPLISSWSLSAWHESSSSMTALLPRHSGAKSWFLLAYNIPWWLMSAGEDRGPVSCHCWWRLSVSIQNYSECSLWRTSFINHFPSSWAISALVANCSSQASAGGVTLLHTFWGWKSFEKCL